MLKVKRWAGLFLLMSSVGYGGDEDLSLGDLFNLAETEVISASKNAKKLKNAPSVVTVWTEKDIKRLGARSLTDLLEYTVGFFMARSYTGNYPSSRGMFGEDRFLLLIDGHATNSIVMKGPGSHHIFPLNQNVKRVEIIRGPGSTLWGGDAVLGIIHVITKDGGDIDGLKTTVSVAQGEGGKEKEQAVNVMFGKKYSEDSQFMMSFDTFQADGFPEGGAWAGRGTYEDAGGERSYIGPWDYVPPSFQLYGKAKLKDFTFVARSSSYSQTMQWGSPNRPTQDIATDETAFGRKKALSMEITYNKVFNEQLSLETKLFGGLIQHGQVFIDPVYHNPAKQPNGVNYERDSQSLEHQKGAELLLSYNAENMILKLGSRYTETDLDAVASYKQKVDGTNEIAFFGFPKDIDRHKALYAEGETTPVTGVDLIAGVRYDENNLREKGGRVLPRFGASYSPQEETRIKYLLNSGYTRPAQWQGFLGQQPTDLRGRTRYGSDKSELSTSHDLQFIHEEKDYSLGLTAYVMKIENIYTYSGEAWDYGPNGEVVPTKDWEATAVGNRPGGTLFVVNGGDMTSKGAEFESKWLLTDRLGVNLGFSYIASVKLSSFEYTNKHVPSELTSKLTVKDGSLVDENREGLTIPRKMLVTGANYAVSDGMNMSVAYRRNEDTKTLSRSKDSDGNPVTGAARYKKLPPSDFIDLALFYETKLAAVPVELSVFGRNLANRVVEIAQLDGGAWESKGRTLGVTTSAKF